MWNEHVQIIAYASILISNEHKKDSFYSEVTEILSGLDPREKVLLLEDFSARVGTTRDQFGQAIGPQNGRDERKCFTLCAEFDLTITNILFKLKII